MAEKLLKRWKSWKDGVGHLIDDGRTEGMYYSSGLLGLDGELRAAPFLNTVTLTADVFTTAMSWRSSVADALIGYAACIVNPVVSGTVAFVDLTNTNGNTIVDGGNFSHSFSHTVPVGANRGLFVAISNSSGANGATAITWDGPGGGGPVALTQIVEGNAVNANASIWRLVAPEEGAGTIKITFTTDVDVIATAYNFTSVHQTTPSFASDSQVRTLTYRGITGVDLDSVANSFAIDAYAVAQSGNTTLTPNSRQTVAQNIESGAAEGGSTRLAITAADPYAFHYFHEEPVTLDNTKAYMYATLGKDTAIHATPRTYKLSLNNATFGVLQTGFYEIGRGAGIQPGKHARYQGAWYIPAGGGISVFRISAVGDGATSTDTTVVGSGTTGAEQLANLGPQLAAYAAELTGGLDLFGGSAGQAGGARILKIDGAAQTDADWGAVFQVGDRAERGLGIITSEGLIFIITREGLFSFNKTARSGLVFEDFRNWFSSFPNVFISQWYGGFLIPHISGLFYYVPGERPIQVPLGDESSLRGLPPVGVTELQSGIFHSTATKGDYSYYVYQPRRSQTSALLLCAYTQSGNPANLTWQGLGMVTLSDIDIPSACFVSTLSQAVSSTVNTPVAWFNDNGNLRYMILNDRASPFRSRADTHRVVASGDSFMSELIFAEPQDMTRFVVYASDMAAGDEWQLTVIVNGTGADIDVGVPIIAPGRHERSFDKQDVYRLTLHVNFVGTSTAARVPPSLNRIELYGPE